jgi:hypothetical protein
MELGVLGLYRRPDHIGSLFVYAADFEVLEIDFNLRQIVDIVCLLVALIDNAPKACT